MPYFSLFITSGAAEEGKQVVYGSKLEMTQVNVLMEMLSTVFLTHVAHSPHPASDEFTVGHFDGQPQVRNTNVSCSIIVVSMMYFYL